MTRQEAVSLRVRAVQLCCGPARSSRGCRAGQEGDRSLSCLRRVWLPHPALPACGPESGSASSPRSSIFNSTIHGFLASENFRLKKKTWRICGCLSKHKQLDAGFCGNT